MTGLPWSDLRWPWLAALLAVLLIILLRRWALRGPLPATGVLVAHTERLKRLPRYRSLARRELAAATVCVLGALALALGAGTVAARPERTEQVQPEREGRDVLLCLEATSKTAATNVRVLEAFGSTLTPVEGDRFAMVFFSDAAVATFPLTDDFEFVRQQLEEAEEEFAGDTQPPGVAGTGDRAGQVGDGLASCVERLGPPERDRGRAVVLTSANQPVGEHIFTLPEAARIAVRSKVVVYGAGTPDLLRRPTRSDPFRTAMEATGGTLSVVKRGTAGPILEGIDDMEEARLATRPTPVQVDDSGAGFAIALVGLTVLLLGVLLGRRA